MTQASMQNNSWTRVKKETSWLTKTVKEKKWLTRGEKQRHPHKQTHYTAARNPHSCPSSASTQLSFSISIHAVVLQHPHCCPSASTQLSFFSISIHAVVLQYTHSCPSSAYTQLSFSSPASMQLSFSIHTAVLQYSWYFLLLVSPLSVINGWLALCPQVLSQASQHFWSEMHAICNSCFACQSICSIISLRSSMFHFCSKLNESVRMARIVWLLPEALECSGHVWLLPPPLSNWRPCWLHCLQEWWSLFAEKPTQTDLCSLVISVHHEIVPFAVSFKNKLDLWISSCTFPTPWLAWAQSASMLAVFIPLLAPSRSVSLCLLQLHGVGCVDFRQHRSNYILFRNQLGYTVAKLWIQKTSLLLQTKT